MNASDISVIIPVYNRVSELTRTLDSLRAQTLDKTRFEVIVADDGSSEDVRGVLAAFPDLNTVYCAQEDMGFRVAAARNLGIAHTHGDILVCNDNGILLSPDTLEQHLRLHNGRDNLLLLGTMFGTSWDSDPDTMRVILDENSPQDSIALMKQAGNMGDGREGYIRRFGIDLSQWYIPWLGLWGGHFSVRAAFLRQHGIAFDENFTSWGGEDNDFGIQLCQAGAHYLLSPDVAVVHYPSPTRVTNDENFREKYAKVKQYIVDKHGTEEVLVWQAIGGGANDAVQRQAALATLRGTQI